MKISITLLWMMVLSYDMRNIFMISMGVTYYDLYDKRWYFEFLDLLGTTFLLLQHWHLTSHYMQTSCLLRLAFSRHSVTALDRARNRRLMLRYVDYSYYGFVLVILILSLIFKGRMLTMVLVLWFISIWAIALINCFSMRRISNELLNVNNILASKKFMAIYVSIFSTAAILTLIVFPL